MTGMLPKTVTPSLVRKLNAAHAEMAGECGGECDGAGYCSAAWRAAASGSKRKDREGDGEDEGH